MNFGFFFAALKLILFNFDQHVFVYFAAALSDHATRFEFFQAYSLTKWHPSSSLPL